MSQAERQHRARERRRKGVAVLQLELPHDLVICALLDSERLNERESRKRAEVERAVSEVVIDWAKRWKK